MPANTPEEVHELFSKLFSAADLDGIVSLYEPGATFMPQPGQPVSGHEQIREALSGFLGLKGDFDLQPSNVIKADDIALLISSWTLKGTDPEGNPVDLSGRTSDVARRQPDGTWLIVIDNPYGTQ